VEDLFFKFIDGVVALGEGVILSSFYFDEDGNRAIFSDDIDFTFFMTPVGMSDGVFKG
jgi:hypothetical protein